MQQKRETRVLFGKLDLDSDERYISTGDYIDIRNFRGARTDNGKDGTIENIVSLQEVTALKDNSGSTIALPNGVNKCIGSHTSESTKRSFIWIWNSEGDHTIWQYDFTNNTQTRLLLDKDWGTINAWATSTAYTAGSSVVSNSGKNWLCTVSHTSSASTEPYINAYYWKELNPYLNFDEFQLIYDIVELQRDGDTLLVWTDGENEVKYINVDRMASSSRVSAELPAIFEEEYFSLIPYTPQLSIPIYDWEGFEITSVVGNTIGVHKSLDTYIRTGDRIAFLGNVTGLSSLNEYYAIYVSNTSLQVASSRENAFAGTAITLSGAGAPPALITRAETIGTNGDNDNKISTKSYQFRYQWEYLDGIKSPWSPISKIPLLPATSPIPSSAVTTIFTGNELDQITNTIHLKIPRRDSYANSYCRKIYISAREVSDGNTGDWRLIKEIDATDTSQANDPRLSGLQTIDTSRLGVANGSGGDQYTDYYEFDFNGTEPTLSISQLETDELFSWLPKKVRSLCLVGDNRIFVANTTEGNDVGFSEPFIHDYTQTVYFLAKASTFQNATDPNDYTNKRTYKRNGTHKFGVIYSDKAGRVSSVIPFADGETVPWYDSTTMNANTYGAYTQMFVGLTLDPPEWAEYYQIVYAKVGGYDTSGDSNGKFRQYKVTSSIGVAGWMYSVILDSLEYTYDNINETNEFVYDFTEGDKVNYLYNAGSANWGSVNSIGANVTKYDSASNVLTLDGSAAFVPTQDDWIEIYTPQKTAKEDENILWYEIGETYRIVRDTAGVKAHAALTDRFPTLTSDQDQNTSLSSSAMVSGGDCYLRARGMARGSAGVNLSTIGVESAWISDKYGDKSSDIGRANLVSEEGLKEIKREATGRISQPYVPNTDINNIGFFYGNDFTEYNKNYGSIQKVYTDSHYLTLFQETKFGKVPISRSLIEDLEGQGLIAIASDLLGNIKYSEEDYGISLNGESHISHGSYQWWADANRNAILELSPNGFRVISDIKCKYYFDQIFQSVPLYSNKVKLIGGYDKEFDEYLLTFDVRFQTSGLSLDSYSGSTFQWQFSNQSEKETWDLGWEGIGVDRIISKIGLDGTRAIVRYTDSVSGEKKEANGVIRTGLPSSIKYIDSLPTGLNITTGGNIIYGFFRDCIAYSPKSQGWSSRYDFECDYWSQNGVKLASIKDGVLYRHNDIRVPPVTYGDFYGTQYDAFVTIPFNDMPNYRKQPLAIELETNNRDGNWSVESATNDRGQETEIPKNLFKEREGDLFATILRDKNSVNVIPPKTELLDGKKIIGNYLNVKLKNVSTGLVNLFSVSLNYILSNYR